MRASTQARMAHHVLFSQQQMKLTAENLKEECREGGKEKAP